MKNMELLDDVKIVWIYMRKYKKTVIQTVVLAIVFALVTGVIPYIYGYLVDLASNNSSSFLIFSLLGVWALTTSISALFKRIISIKGGFIAGNVQADFICEKAKYVINLPLTFHREKKTGETLSKITRASDSLQRIIDDIIFWMFPQLLTIIVGLAFLLFINWQLFTGALIIFLLSIIITFYRTSFIVEAQILLSKKYEKGTGYLNDSFLNIQTIKSCGSEEFQDRKLSRVYKDEFLNAFKKIIILWDNTIFFQEIIFSLGFVIIFGYAILLLGAGKITSGTLVMFLGYLTLIRNPLRMLIWQYFHFQRGMASIKRARSFLDLKPEDYNKNGKVLEHLQGKVEFKNISFSYEGKQPVLNNISFIAMPGQKVALIGGSGEGKTTTVDLLSLYFEPAKGNILIDNTDIKDLKLGFLRSIIAYVPQEIILFNDTIKNNILYGKPKATEKEIIQSAKAANIHSFIESLPKKYNTLVGERGIKLSTGQKQRLAIARAIIRNPKILVLDEATSSLDIASEKLIQEALERLIENKTTFIIAHRLSTVRKADKILVLEKGKIIEAGNHQELMKKKGQYFKFYSLQFSQE